MWLLWSVKDLEPQWALSASQQSYYHPSTTPVHSLDHSWASVSTFFPCPQTSHICPLPTTSTAQAPETPSPLHGGNRSSEECVSTRHTRTPAPLLLLWVNCPALGEGQVFHLGTSSPPLPHPHLAPVIPHLSCPSRCLFPTGSFPSVHPVLLVPALPCPPLSTLLGSCSCPLAPTLSSHSQAPVQSDHYEPPSCFNYG